MSHNKPMNTCKEVIQQWPRPMYASLGGDVGEHWETVRKWGQRDNIPSRKWLQVCAAAERRGISLTLTDLAELAAK